MGRGFESLRGYLICKDLQGAPVGLFHMWNMPCFLLSLLSRPFVTT